MLQQTVKPISNMMHIISRILLLGMLGFYATVSFGEAPAPNLPTLDLISVDVQKIEPARIIPTVEQTKLEPVDVKAAEDTTPVTKPTTTPPQVSVSPDSTQAKSIIAKPVKPTSVVTATEKTTSVSAIKIKQPAQKQLSTPSTDDNLVAAADKTERAVRQPEKPVAGKKPVDKKPAQTDADQKPQANAKAKVCRTVEIPGVKGEKKLCGTEEDWQAFESRKASISPDMTCRMLKNWQTNEVKQYCANEEQWADYDRQVALNKKTEICRPVVMGLARERCMTITQWQVFDFKRRSFADSLNMGHESSIGSLRTPFQGVQSLAPQ